MIILLDLNYTLVENSDVKASPFTKQIEKEVYRKWLIELCRPYHTIMITARPANHQAQTLQHIFKTTKWMPQECYFNIGLKPPQWKEQVLDSYVFPRFAAKDLLAIESNPATRAMYARRKVASIKVGHWRTIEEARQNAT